MQTLKRENNLGEQVFFIKFVLYLVIKTYVAPIHCMELLALWKENYKGSVLSMGRNRCFHSDDKMVRNMKYSSQSLRDKPKFATPHIPIDPCFSPKYQRASPSALNH